MPFNPSDMDVGRQYTRPQLALMWGYKSHAAIARGVVTPAGTGYILLFVTREKQTSLTQYKDFLSGDCLHWEGEEQHRNDLRVARAHEKGEEIHLFYRDVHHTPFTYYGQILTTSFRERADRPSEFTFQLTHDLGPADDIETRRAELEVLPETEREVIVKARVGQGRFRDDLLEYWHGCAVTDIRRPDLLRASHIKPWRWSTNHERLDRFNGLLLLPHYDLLFDRGYITFDETGRILRSPAISKVSTSRLGIDPGARLRRVDDAHISFLEYHHDKVFVKQVGEG